MPALKIRKEAILKFFSKPEIVNKYLRKHALVCLREQRAYRYRNNPTDRIRDLDAAFISYLRNNRRKAFVYKKPWPDITRNTVMQSGNNNLHFENYTLGKHNIHRALEASRISLDYNADPLLKKFTGDSHETVMATDLELHRKRMIQALHNMIDWDKPQSDSLQHSLG